MPMRVVRFARRMVRARWQAAAISLLALAAAALGSWQVIVNSHEDDRINRQLCRAIPNSAARTAQALVDVLVADAQRRGVPAAQIANTRRLGAIYVHRARQLALSDLPACPEEDP